MRVPPAADVFLALSESDEASQITQRSVTRRVLMLLSVGLLVLAPLLWTAGAQGVGDAPQALAAKSGALGDPDDDDDDDEGDDTDTGAGSDDSRATTGGNTKSRSHTGRDTRGDTDRGGQNTGGSTRGETDRDRTGKTERTQGTGRETRGETDRGDRQTGKSTRGETDGRDGTGKTERR